LRRPSRPLDQNAEDIERARADRDRLILTDTIAAEQATAPVEAEVLEEKNVRRSDPLHARFPAVSSERPRREIPRRRIKALYGQHFGALRKISEDFIADSLLVSCRRSP
jgi:hypothetical protein